MVGPSLQKHAETVKSLEAQLVDVQEKNSQKHEETLLQIANLATQIAEMGVQFQGITS